MRRAWTHAGIAFALLACAAGPQDAVVTAIPVRALDPILHVADASVREYHYADKDRTLVFTLVDDKLLREDAEVFVQFGDDMQSRTPHARFKRTQVREVTQ